MKKFEKDGISIAYFTEGEGAAVVFLHGFPDSSAIWRAQAGAAARAGLRAVVPDLRGFGLSSKPKTIAAYKLEEVAKDIYGLIEHLRIDRFFLVGHDWGSALAWHIAARIPQRVKALAALSQGHAMAFFPAGGTLQRQMSWYMLFFQHPGAEKLLEANDWALWRSFLQDEPPELVEAQIDRLSKDGALSAGLGYYRANVSPASFATTQFRDVPKLPMPVLGIWSDGDVALTEQQMKGSARYVAEGRFQYKRIEGVGHWLQIQAPDEVNKALLQFFEKAEKSPWSAL